MSNTVIFDSGKFTVAIDCVDTKWYRLERKKDDAVTMVSAEDMQKCMPKDYTSDRYGMQTVEGKIDDYINDWFLDGLEVWPVFDERLANNFIRAA